MRAILASCVVLAGCSDLLGIGDLSGPAPVDSTPRDAPIDVIVPDQITVAGSIQILDVGLAISSGDLLQLDFIRMPDRTILATTTSGVAGSFSVLLPTLGAPLDGYFRVRGGMAAVDLDSSVYSPVPFTNSGQFDFVLLTNALITELSQKANEPQSPDTAFVMVSVSDPSGQPLQGATVQTQMGLRVVYAGDNLEPLIGATATGTSGIAFLFNVLPTETLLSVDVGGAETTRIADITSPGSAHYVGIRSP